ncbi:MAG TPA: hypothetical protein VEB21_03865, partial [Terriglobales bacterium]|nr:hypothetical protein [Terriglobales bacterium]
SKQFTSGRVPCCVDDRGPDPTPEYDSDGELIFAIAEYYRYTGDAELVYALWGNVVAAVGHIQDLRAKRMTERYQRPSLRAFYGLLPESISHEGYAAHPVHSYWDDFFALRGLRDAVTLATVVGDHGRAQQYEQWRAELERNVVDSIGLTVAVNAIRYIPGSVELGDFDPTATSILATIGIELPGLAPHLLPATFERYYRFFQDRQSNASAWTNYAPYEFRNVGAFVQLGQRERANEVLRFLMSHRRPQAWNQWPEIVWRDLEAPRFIGDMPHTWVGSSFLSAVRMMLVYEKLDDNQLVLAAGVASEWLDGDNTVVVRDLPTELGRISYELRRDREGVHMEISGELRSAPRLVLRPPLPPGVTGATIDGEPAVEFDSESLLLDRLPATVVFKLPSETHR